MVEVVDTHLWDDDTRTLRESFAPDWSDPEDYRGANANMHGVEAFIAMGHATGDALWHERALDVADRLVNRAARAHDWLLPEHFSTTWDELPDYNRDDPQHPFRPFGATFGHSLEWARFLLQLEASPLVASPGWLREGAEQLTRRALDGGWALDGRPGLVYTVDWDGAPVADVRLHWPVCEGIQVTAALVRRTGDASLGGLVPPALGPRRAVLRRRARHVAQRARRRRCARRARSGPVGPTSTTASARSSPRWRREAAARRPQSRETSADGSSSGRPGAAVAVTSNRGAPEDPPRPVVMATSAASRPVPIRTIDARGASRVASTSRQTPSTETSTTAWASIGDSPGA